MSKIVVSFVLLVLSVSAFAQNLKVGLSAKDITPKLRDQIPLGGFGSAERRNWPFRLYRFPHIRYFRVAQGGLDPIRVKSMFLEKADSKMLFISMDVIGVTKDMRRDLVKKLRHLKIKDSHILVSGTHTHSGPGGLAKNFFWEIFAMDRFQKKYYNKFLNDIVTTVEESIAKSKEADLYSLKFESEGLQKNRRGADRPLDRAAKLLVAQGRDGEWLGGIVNYAVHGTSLGASNVLFSADAPGAIERELEALVKEKNGIVRLDSHPTFLFINGAQGDVSPGKHYRELGRLFAEKTEANWNSMLPMNASWEVSQTQIKLGRPKIKLRKCVDENWMPKRASFGLGLYVSSKTVLTKVKFGPIWMYTWPGEPTVELGQNLVRIAKEQGAEDAWVMGLTNDHLAYFTMPHEFETGGYESCVNFFGGNGGVSILNAYEELSKIK